MTLATLIRYLIGQRRAILQIAATPGAIWLGLLFVASAGFAREYDGEDLLHEPWHLLLPLVASLATSFLLFCVLWASSRKKDQDSLPFLPGYRSFLGLYWMTAPLAWLYALPVEQFFSAEAAARTNLWLLAIVATWRVLLMTRVVSVLFDARFREAFPVVMLFADTVALVLLSLAPVPVVDLMGGIRNTASERLIYRTALLVGWVGMISWPIWLTWTIETAFGKRFSRPSIYVFDERRVSYTVLAVALASLAIWIPVLPRTQPAQQLRRSVERDLREGRIERALATMSRHEPGDFPPHWDPPPRVGYGERQPPLLDVVDAVLANEPRPWVAEIFLAKLQRTGYRDFESWESDYFDQFLDVLERLPDNSPFLNEHQHALETQLEERSQRSEEQQERLRSLLESGDE